MTFEDRYGRLDRLLHRIAFRAGRAQQALADVEAMLFGDELDSVRLESPVFVSALPRCGTTILLNLLWETDRFASHTYRDMPFVLAPMLWRRFSASFAVERGPRERDHEDGIEISGDSPEAFEEMIWKRFWPEHYRSDRILPWEPSERESVFEEFLERHMRKVVALGDRGRAVGEADPPRRYLSKNNLNIARLAALPNPLCQGLLLVPFREPLQHAGSMFHQHQRFLELHREDPFMLEYMEAIGHHEFGQALRPVDFGEWLQDAGSPAGVSFWVRYWTAAYRHVLEHESRPVRLVSYAALTSDPSSALARLARVVGVPEEELTRQADRLRPPREHDVDESDLAASDRDTAEDVYRQLRERAVV